MSRHNQALPLFSPSSSRAAWPAVLVLLLTLMVLVACGSSTSATGDAAVQITLLPGTTADSFQVQLHNPDHTPLTDATVTLEANMNHAGMAPVSGEPVQDSADGASDGIYTIPFQFSMLGDWIITVKAELGDGTQATKDVNVTVTDAGIQIQDGAQGSAGQTNQSPTGALTVQDAMANAVPLAGGNGAIYFTVMNGTTQADRLVAVESDIAESTTMHESINENNVVRMEARPDGFALPAGGSVELAPGGKHVMLMNLKQTLVEGEHFTITLRFEHAAPLSVTVPIMGLGSSRAGEHQHGGN